MLSLRVNSGVAELLSDVASCSGVAQSLREEAKKLKGSEEIQWDRLKEIAEAYRKCNPGKPVYLHRLCSQQDIVLQAPPPKERNPALVARLNKLQQELDNKRYAEMVSDITERERSAEESRDAMLPNTRLQLSFGAHVLVTMFALWAVAYYGSKMWLGFDELWAGLCGAMGLTVGLLVETLLLIIRTNRPEQTLEERMPELFDKEKVRANYELLKQLKQKEKKAKQQQQLKGGKAAPTEPQSSTAAAGAGGAAGDEPSQGAAAAESKKSR